MGSCLSGLGNGLQTDETGSIPVLLSILMLTS